MRTDRLVILAFLVGCKAATPTMQDTGAYSEDLSIHRPVMLPAQEVNDGDTSQEVQTEAYLPMVGHIRAELDSIGKIALAENRAGKYVDGFVIQVYSGSDRAEANEALNQMSSLFPDLKAKMSYRQPNFRVKAGRFTDRLEANRVYRGIKDAFPKALLIPERFLMKYE